MKPDVGAPGGQILFATLAIAGGPFAVFDGTSMAAPHVAGAAALLLQQHPAWTPQQVKSALMTSAAPAWGDTARTQEASVLLEGAGLIDVAAANHPSLFAEPSSLSFGFLDTTTGAPRKALLLSLSDAGTGGGAWSVAVQPQSATAGITRRNVSALQSNACSAVTPGSSERCFGDPNTIRDPPRSRVASARRTM